jgi:hypothetical protein
MSRVSSAMRIQMLAGLFASTADGAVEVKLPKKLPDSIQGPSYLPKGRVSKGHPGTKVPIGKQRVKNRARARASRKARRRQR